MVIEIRNKSKEYEKNFLRYRPIDIEKDKLDIDEEKQIIIPSIKSFTRSSRKREKSILTRRNKY